MLLVSLCLDTGDYFFSVCSLCYFFLSVNVCMQVLPMGMAHTALVGTSGTCSYGARNAFPCVYILVLFCEPAVQYHAKVILCTGLLTCQNRVWCFAFKQKRGSEWGRHWITERNKNGALVMAFFLFDSFFFPSNQSWQPIMQIGFSISWTAGMVLSRLQWPLPTFHGLKLKQ